MIEIRRAVPADVAALAPLFDAYRGFYGRPSDLPLARRFLTERLARGESVILLALDGTELCGFTQLYPLYSSLRCRPIWILSDLFVTPGRRRSGAGRQLLEAAHAFGRAQGAASIELDTAHTNTAAQALYESLGYERDREFRHYALSL